MATAGQKLGARPFMTTVPADDDYMYIVDDSETVILQKSKRIKWSVLRGGISASAPVQSVFGRTGTVTALASDYDDSQIDYNGSPVNFTATGTSVAIALDGIDNSLGNLQPLDGNLTDFAALSPTSDEFIYTVTGAYVLGSFSPFARTLVDDTTAAAMRTTLGAQITGTYLIASNDLSDVASASTARTNLGLAIGTNVQAWDDNLDDLAALTPTKGNLLAGNGTDWVALGVGTNTQVLTADSTEASGIKWAAAAGGGGASLTVDTRANILATASPSSGDMFYATDSEEFFIHDGTDFQVAPLEHQATSTTPDMGLQPTMVANDLAGYSDEYITDKLLSNVKLGDSVISEANSIRISDATFQVYVNGAWNDVVINFRFREDSSAGDSGNTYEFEHKPVGLVNWYEVMSGNSDKLALNGLPVTQQYTVDQGAYPTHLQIVGRSFS